MKAYQNLTDIEFNNIVGDYKNLKSKIRSLANTRSNNIKKGIQTDSMEEQYKRDLDQLQSMYTQFEIPYICNNCKKVFNISFKNFKKLIKEPNYPFCCSKSCATTYKNIKYYNSLTEKQKLDRNKQISNTLKSRIEEDEQFRTKVLNNCDNLNNVYWKNISFEHRSEINKKSALVAKNTKLQRYGSENYNNNEQTRITNIEKYGVDCQFKRQDLRAKQKEIINKKYGVNNFFENRQEFKRISLQRYNTEHPMQNKGVKQKLYKTKLIRYGNGNYNNTKKFEETFLAKYGVKRPFQLPHFIAKANLTKYKNFNTLDKISYGQISKVNRRFADFIEANEFEFPIDTYSYDIKLGNILFEIDPTFTHNCYGNKLVGKFSNVDVEYHFKKTLKAQQYGYRCIHVFDWDDWYKVKYLIQDKQVLYARNLEIKEVSLNELDNFLNLYHLQNTCKGQQIRLGLFYNNELIQTMTFGKPRYNSNYEYELLRLCTHKDYKIVGGAERLFKYFIRKYNPKSVISYCDISKFTGEVYTRLGFTQKGKTSPRKHWSKGSKQITDNLLRQRGYDQLFNTNYGKGTDNEQLMLNNGWLPVYDCGQLTFTWHKS